MKEELIIPEHIGIIMDGNGRWAKKRLLPRNMGHKKGAEVFKDIARYCDDLGMEAVTFYAFSTENWKRPIEEVSGIFKLLIVYMERELEELHANNVKVNIFGDYSIHTCYRVFKQWYFGRSCGKAEIHHCKQK